MRSREINMIRLAEKELDTPQGASIELILLLLLKDCSVPARPAFYLLTVPQCSTRVHYAVCNVHPCREIVYDTLSNGTRVKPTRSFMMRVTCYCSEE